MSGLYNVFKVYTPGEILTAADLNSTDQNHVTYNTALAARGYSETLDQSRIQAASTSLAISIADELARIREKLRLLGGVTYWDQIIGPSVSPFALPKAQVYLPLEGATLPDGTSGNAFPSVSERISTATIPPGNTQPKIVEVIYDFDPATPQYLMWKFKTPLGYVPGELIDVIMTFSTVAPAADVTPVGDKFRPVVGVAPVKDELDNVGTAVTSATMFGPDNVVIPTASMQKEYRIALPTTGITEDMKVILVVGCLPATLDNFAGKRRLEAVVVEFSRGQFILDDPGMQNPMEQLGDLIVGGNTGTPQRLAIGVEGQILTSVSGIAEWVDPPGGFDNPMTTTGDLIQAGSGGDPARLPIGPHGYVLTAMSGLPSWEPSQTGMNNPMTNEGDLVFQQFAVPARLGISSNGYVLTVVAGYPAWEPKTPIVAEGDLIIGSNANLPQRLAIGTAGQVLTVVGTTAVWSAPTGGMTNPMTAVGDVIIGGASGAPTRLPVGADTQVLTLVAGVPTWQAPLSGGMTNPMTTQWDIIVGGASGTPTRFAKGTDTFVLTMVAGAIAWAAPTGGGGGMTNPMTAAGDIIVGAASGTPARLAKGLDTQVLTLVAGTPSWQTPASGGMTNPMTSPGDMIYGGAAGVATRLPGTSAGATLTWGTTPAWTFSPNHVSTLYTVATAPGTPATSRVALYAKTDKKLYQKDDSGLETLLAGMANPMISAGDIIVGGVSGAPSRLGVGTNGFVLTLVAGTPAWVAGGVSFPLLAPDGTAAAPSYSFSGDSSTGMFRAAGGHLTLDSEQLIVLARGGATAWWIDSSNGWQPGTDVAFDIGAAATQVRNIFTVGTTMPITLPASIPTPASGKVTIFSNTDKHLWEKDDTGASRRVGAAGGGANYIRLPISQADLPDGTTDNLPAEFIRDISSGTIANGPKVTRTYAKFTDAADRTLSWTFIIPSNYVGGGTIRLKFKSSAAGGGNVVWKAGAAPVIDGSTNDTTMNYNAVDIATAVAAPATIGQHAEATITLTATNFAAGRLVTVFVGRDTNNAADTSTNDAIMTAMQFEYV